MEKQSYHEVYSDTNQVDSQQSLENVESKWVGEITDNCPGVKLVLVALKCDLREKHTDDTEEGETTAPTSEKTFIDYDTGLAVAKRIQALRYLGTVDIDDIPCLGTDLRNRMFC